MLYISIQKSLRIDRRVYTHIIIYAPCMKQLIIEMDEKTHKQFRQTTLADDTSMAEIVRGCIKKYLAEKTMSVVY